MRARHTDLTRRAILDAARKLFASRGYARTPMRTLAEKAGVAPRTIYLAFGSKRGVLIGLVNRLAEEAGEDQIRLQMARVTTGEEILKLVARLYRRLYESGADVIAMLQQGAAMEAEVRAAFELGHKHSRRSVQRVCARLAELGQLRSNLDVDRASGHTLVLIAPDGYEELVVLRRWSHDDYETWLFQSLAEALLPSAPRRRSAKPR